MSTYENNPIFKDLESMQIRKEEHSHYRVHKRLPTIHPPSQLRTQHRFCQEIFVVRSTATYISHQNQFSIDLLRIIVYPPLQSGKK